MWCIQTLRGANIQLSPPPRARGCSTRCPRALILYAPLGITCERSSFVRVASKVGLWCLMRAKFQLRAAHLLLTGVSHAALTCCSWVSHMHDQQHLRWYLEEHLNALQEYTAHHTGWRLIVSTCGRAPHARRLQDVDSHTRDIHSARSMNAFDVLMHASALTDCVAPSRPQRHHRLPALGSFSGLGTLNVAGLNTSKGFDKLHSIVSLMHAHSVGVLALQETRIVLPAVFTQLLQDCAGNDYSYYGEPAVLLPSGAPSGGSGFLVHASMRHRVAYLGLLSTDARFRTPWLTVKGRGTAAPMHIGCVYLPDDSIYKKLDTCPMFTEALAALDSDLSSMRARSGNVALLGDFNCRLGNNQGAQRWDNARAPARGEHTCTPQGRDLLETAAAHELCFLSSQGAGPTKPTFVGDAGTSILDHILVGGAPLLQECLATTLAADAPEVRDCGRDHVPV
jgi:Endonuclease-reverse transcriptase